MPTASQALSEFALALRYEQIPANVIERARSCIIDTIGAAFYGSRLPWSRIVLDFARINGAAGDADVIGAGIKLRPPFAAMVNGAYAHAFELDSMCQPSVGAHPGASLGTPGLAVAQTFRASGKDLLTAFVAGCEVMYRIGEAAHHSSERLGFHAPGLLGVFGGAVTAGRLMGLDAGRMANALGISGSLCCGLLEFSKSGGGMVKRLHQGRASEGAVTAAMLAREGYAGPPAVLEGKFGFLNVFCRDADVTRLTADLGKEWRTLRTTLKRYACHSTAHVAVTAALELKSREGISGGDIDSIRIAGSEKLVSHHQISEPTDVAMAQYSAPFSVALAFFRDPRDPSVFSDESLNDAAIRALCRKVTLEHYADGPRDNKLASRVIVRMKDGRELKQDMEYFPGMPQRPLNTEQLWEKFSRLTPALPGERARRLFDRLLELEKFGDLGELDLGAA
ncbi:MAG: MmgE/PrpD family protein [Betaproteobacteria bacterium]|nr:MmgE/PrpD family protein [Betaproteobacteria bacterium]